MDIVLLEYYLRIFAIIGNIFPYIPIENIKDFLRTSVFKDLTQEIKIESLKLFNEYYNKYSENQERENIELLIKTVRQAKVVIPLKQKFQIFLRFLLFEKTLLRYTSFETDISISELVKKLAMELSIRKEEYLNCKGFISEKFYQVHDIRKLLFISATRHISIDIPFMERQNFHGQLVFLYKENPNLVLFIYKGTQAITYNNQAIYAGTIYFFNKGSVIKGENFEPIYYNQVFRKFKVHEHVELNLTVRDLDFKYKNSNQGIHKLNIDIEAEQLIGIIGRSGVGKSTLINLLIGNKQPNSGSITINGHDLKYDKDKLTGVIGYVSQDDLLIEELTVFKNLHLNAKLCFGDLSEQELKEKVEHLLMDLDLYEVKDLQVGTPLNRLISGGQRKKLNIALELIREPWILFADEPTSGLSSSDSEEIMNLLSEQATKGKIVFVNIHQPSSDIFKLFDKIIVMDKGGYPVYFGNPLDSIQHFNEYNQRIFSTSEICDVCENINPESIFKVLEEKKTNEFGEYTRERKTTPIEWHNYYLSKSRCEKEKEIIKTELPKIKFNKPNAVKQFGIFSIRNILTKITNYQYILLVVLISPVLAAVLSLLCKYENENNSDYIFALNDNIPSYFFMSVIVAVFLGLIMSAEEIIMDRKILMRENYLKLSKISYLNSKVAYIFGVSALQMFLYVLIGNSILKIDGMLFNFWIVLFSLSCFANLMGLFISSIFNSVITIYILVPLIIVPQMLLSGVVVNFDKLNKNVTSHEYVPLVGDLMASRWAYEALMVKQFRSNDFQRFYFETEKKESKIKYNLLLTIPELQNAIENIHVDHSKENIRNKMEFLNNEFHKLKLSGYYHGTLPINTQNLNKTYIALDSMSTKLSLELDKVHYEKDSITSALVAKLGGINMYNDFKNKNYNNSLADIVLKRKELELYTIEDKKMIRKMEPIYQDPFSNLGRAHFLASTKFIGNYGFKTFSFNITVLWIMSTIAYLTLLVILITNNPFKNYISQIKEKRYSYLYTSIVKFRLKHKA